MLPQKGDQPFLFLPYYKCGAAKWNFPHPKIAELDEPFTCHYPGDNYWEQVYVSCECSLSHLASIEKTVTDAYSLTMKRLSSLDNARSFHHGKGFYPRHLPTRRKKHLSHCVLFFFAEVLWFPKCAADLDLCQHMREKPDHDGITEEHPGFQDPDYAERRRNITEIAMRFKQ